MVKVESEIHLLLVGPDTEPKALKKQARKYAMTGGYELALQEGLSDADLVEVFQLYVTELEQYPEELAPTSNPYRVIRLVLQSERLEPATRAAFESDLSKYSIEFS